MKPEALGVDAGPSTRAMLWVNRPALLLERVGGLTVFERQLITLERAGIRRVWVGAKNPGEPALAKLRLPKSLEIHWASPKLEAPAECQTPYLGVSGDHFARVETLDYIVHAPYMASVSFHDSKEASVAQIIATRSEDSLTYHKQPFPEGSSVFLDVPLKHGAVMEWLLTLVPKVHDGFMARHFDRHISLAISELLLDAPVTASLMTAFSCAIGLAGAALFAYARHDLDVAGAFLVWLQSVLDGCDGELARIRFQESRWGADFDFWGDNLVHLALFAAMAIGLHRSLGSGLCLALGACAAIGIIGSAVLTFRTQTRERASPALGSAPQTAPVLSRLEAILAQRDFIYLLLATSILGLNYYFLWAGAVGAPLFMIMLSAGKNHPARVLDAQSA